MKDEKILLSVTQRVGSGASCFLGSSNVTTYENSQEFLAYIVDNVLDTESDGATFSAVTAFARR